jgi:hypothetical protein
MSFDKKNLVTKRLLYNFDRLGCLIILFEQHYSFFKFLLYQREKQERNKGPSTLMSEVQNVETKAQ